MRIANLVGVLVGAAAIVSAAVVGGAQTAAPRGPSESGAFLLLPGRVSELEVGMLVDDLYERVGRSETRLVDLFYEGFFTPAIEVDLPASPVSPALVALIRQWPCPSFTVSQIRVNDPRFRTPEGIGVSSTLGEVRRAYAVTLSRAEGDRALAASIQMSFDVSVDSGDDARVTAVWVRDPNTSRPQQECAGR
jgi:hypothetical protein